MSRPPAATVSKNRPTTQAYAASFPLTHSVFDNEAAASTDVPPLGSLVSYVEEFNSILKKMLSDLIIRYPTDATIGRAKRRILLAMDLDPVSIIDAVGPYLYAYREGIYAGNADLFIENDYVAELEQSVDVEKADLVSYIIPKVKMAWGESGTSMREVYKTTVQTLLDVYLDYLAV